MLIITCMQEIEIKLKKICRTAVKNYEKNIAKNAKKNPKAFFLYASSKCKTNNGISDLKIESRPTKNFIWWGQG